MTGKKRLISFFLSAFWPSENGKFLFRLGEKHGGLGLGTSQANMFFF